MFYQSTFSLIVSFLFIPHPSVTHSAEVLQIFGLFIIPDGLLMALLLRPEGSGVQFAPEAYGVFRFLPRVEPEKVF